MQRFQIGPHSFLAMNMIDATVEAIALARTLHQAGQPDEARRLHEEALLLRQIELAAIPHRGVLRLERRAAMRHRRFAS